MYGRHLHGGAPRRCQPAEPFGLAQLAERAGRRAAGADERDQVEVGLYHFQIQARREDVQPRAVQVNPCRQKPSFPAAQDHARVDELFAFDLGTMRTIA